MSLYIDIGLFKFDFTDCHAVLGIPIDADFKDIRQQYLKIARRLHPDSTAAKGEVARQKANDLFSKIVNPAYEKFTTERSRAEYTVLLKDISKRVRQEQNPQFQHEASQELAKTNNIEHTYKTALHKLALNQYEDLDRVLEIIAQISELNLVYLMRQADRAFTSTSQSFPSNVSKALEDSKQTPPPPDAPAPETLVEQYLRRAQKLMEKNNFAHARVELQDALKLEPNNTIAHSLMGIVYLKQNQLTMARVHINKALQLNPNEPMALRSKQVLAEAVPKIEGQTHPAKTTGAGADKPKGGLFGGLFGGKKNK
ncbi:J domain-containing protein [Synechocystis sp. PCC 7509]|uniref:J domain-containing protein n=1 Tax=Synechocystis sp. PCC 7509 TaxID=927677 RepID=UPI0002AB9C77|nr:J domain-containing protein [Synechocystis sp. PCC 7509]